MVVINAKSSQPIYEQIIEQVKEDVMKGYLKQGDSIPSTRKLAIQIGVNPNTVARAYQELERQNIIETVQGRGTFIADGIQLKFDLEKIPALRAKLKAVVMEMRYMNMSHEEIWGEIEKILTDLKGASL